MACLGILSMINLAYSSWRYRGWFLYWLVWKKKKKKVGISNYHPDFVSNTTCKHITIFCPTQYIMSNRVKLCLSQARLLKNKQDLSQNFCQNQT